MRGQDPQEVLSVLGKSYSAEILLAADEPQSAQEFSEELDIPIATCYRRVEELTEHELLESYPSTESRQKQIYQRAIDDVYIHFNDRLSLSLTRPSKVQTTIDKLWNGVR